jgi:hypothetical protein
MNTTDIKDIGVEPVDIGGGFKACQFNGSACYKLINKNGGCTLLSWLDLKSFIRYLNNPTPLEKLHQKLLGKLEDIR